MIISNPKYRGIRLENSNKYKETNKHRDTKTNKQTASKMTEKLTRTRHIK